jgi:hypothetical protein
MCGSTVLEYEVAVPMVMFDQLEARLLFTLEIQDGVLYVCVDASLCAEDYMACVLDIPIIQRLPIDISGRYRRYICKDTNTIYTRVYLVKLWHATRGAHTAPPLSPEIHKTEFSD